MKKQEPVVEVELCKDCGMEVAKGSLKKCSECGMKLCDICLGIHKEEHLEDKYAEEEDEEHNGKPQWR